MQKQEYVQQMVSRSYERAARDPLFLDKLISDRQAALEEVFEEIPGDDGTERPVGAEKKEVFAKTGTYLSTAPIFKRAEMEKPVGQLIDDSRTAYLRTIVQSQALFWVGVLIAVVTVGVELWGVLTGVAWGPLLTGGLFGGGLGLGFVYTAFIKRPLDQLQNAVGNLAQIQIAFLGYLDQVAVLMAQVAQGSLDEATRISDALGQAAEDTAARIERYCEYRGNDGALSPSSMVAAPPPPIAVAPAPPPG
ncbi:MAG: hypothetical protein P1V51_20510 [Deltaproteobacteria bacterium]|nr:hypothetical protein [Deltaproteobacteria bacterium]